MSTSTNQIVRATDDPVMIDGTPMPGFKHGFATVDGVRLHYVEGGHSSGETLVLVAGFPESWFAWRRIMPALGERYRIIAPDLPGQGDSDCPADGYDTLTLAHALHGILSQIGISRYDLVAHDVGAWVAWPYAATFGHEVKSLTLLDAGIPGITLPDALPIAPDKAWRTWHFAFHTIPDLPEVLIAGKERAYLDWFLRRKTANPRAFSESDLDEYERVFKRAGALRAGLAYYRSAALSAAQNKAIVEKTRLRMPVLAVSADQGSIPDMAAPLRTYADAVTGAIIEHCGHFIPEEQPDALVAELLGFLD